MALFVLKMEWAGRRQDASFPCMAIVDVVEDAVEDAAQNWRKERPSRGRNHLFGRWVMALFA